MMNRKKCAVFTMAKNERWFLPIWVNYYSQFFNESDIYILNHASTDDSIDIIRSEYKNINIIDLTYEPFDDVFKVNEIRKLQSTLLETYQSTLFSDPDELIVPVNNFNLTEYIDKFLSKPDQTIKSNGWEIIHLPNKNEPDIDLSQPILSQRSYWFHSPQWYSKIALSKTMVNWSAGLHAAANTSTADEDLYLIHLHRIDYVLSYIKNVTNNQFKRPQGME